MPLPNSPSKLAYVINADWYFKLHWINRALAAQNKGWQIYIITAFVSQGIKEELESAGFICINISLSRSGINIFKEIQSVARIYFILKKIRPDIVHTITVKPNIYGGIASRILGIPAVKSITGLGSVFSENTMHIKIIRTLILLLYQWVGRAIYGVFIFENSEDKSLFKKNRISQNHQLIHIPGAGVDLEKFAFSPKAFNARRFTLLFAARMLKDKGLDTLVQAVGNLKAKGINCELLVAGILDTQANNPYSKNEIDLLAAQKKIIWLGQVDQMPSLINRVDIVVLPTRYGEGIPRILIEAGAVGRLVITSNISGCRELIRDHSTGLLVEPGSCRDIVEAILYIIDHPDDYKKLVNNLYREILKKYTDQAVISKFLSIYETYR